MAGYNDIHNFFALIAYIVLPVILIFYFQQKNARQFYTEGIIIAQKIIRSMIWTGKSIIPIVHYCVTVKIDDYGCYDFDIKTDAYDALMEGDNVLYFIKF